MTITVTQRAALGGDTAAGVGGTVPTFTATGSGKLYVLAGIANDSSIAYTSPTIANDGSQHGATDWTVIASQTFASASASHGVALLESSNYTATNDTIVFAWGAGEDSGIRYWHCVEVTSDGTLVRYSGTGAIASAESATAGLINENMVAYGTTLIQWTGAATGTHVLTPLAHFATSSGGTLLHSGNVSGLISAHISYRSGSYMINPTLGGLQGTTPPHWACFGLMFYDGTVPSPRQRFRAQSSRQAGTSPITCPDLGTEVTGDLDIVHRALKGTGFGCTSPIPAGTQTDFTTAANVTGGTGAQAVDAGQQANCVDYRTLNASTDTGTFTAANTGSALACAHMRLWYSNLGANAWEITATSGDDATHGTGRTATGSGTLAFEPGDTLLAFVASDTDATTPWTSAALTASGVTFGPTIERMSAGGTSTGNDAGQSIYQAEVASGTATVAPTLTLVGGPSNCGAVIFLLVHTDAAAGGTVTGTVAQTFSFSGTADGDVVNIGTVAQGFTFSGVTAGDVVRVGTASQTFTFSGSAAGKPVRVGAAAQTFTFSGAASGVVIPPPNVVTGAASQTFAFSGATAGDVVRRGTAAQTFTFAGTSAGDVVRRGTAAQTYTFSGTANGLRRILGTVARTYTFSGTVDGDRRRSGTVAQTFVFSGTSSGTVLTSANIVTGAAAQTFTFAGTVAGDRRRQGTVAQGFGFTGASSGLVRHHGGAAQTFIFAGTVSGSGRHLGSVTQTFVFSGQAFGEKQGQAVMMGPGRGRSTSEQYEAEATS